MGAIGKPVPRSKRLPAIGHAVIDNAKRYGCDIDRIRSNGVLNRTGGKYYMLSEDIVRGWVESLATAPAKSTASRRYSKPSCWLGNDTLEEHIGKLRNGDKAIAEAAKEYAMVAREIAVEMIDKPGRILPSFHGSRVNVARYCQGLPDVMMRKQDKPTKRPVRVFVDGSSLSSGTAEGLTRKTAILLSAVNAIQTVQTVSLFGMQSFKKGSDRQYATLFPIGTSPLNLSKAAAFLSPSTMRRLMPFEFLTVWQEDSSSDRPGRDTRDIVNAGPGDIVFGANHFQNLASLTGQKETLRRIIQDILDASKA